MANKSISEKIEEFATPIINKLGYEVIEIEYGKKYGGNVLTIYISTDRPITLDDCEIVSKALDQPLEDNDPTNGQSYTFNVSSEGLDRPLVNKKDFDRNIGTEIEVKCFKPIVENQKTVTGIILSTNDKNVILSVDKKNIEIEFKNIAKASKTIKF